MDQARWDRIQSIFHQVLDHPESERQTFLATACGDDADLLAQVTAMLRADSRDTSLLDQDLHQVAQQVLDSSASLASAQEFGPYRLMRVLGEGGMGVVWLAERRDAGNLVAIKFLPHAGLSPARRERFTQEIKTLGKLTHPRIARLYDAGTLDDGTPWFVMEYVDGVRLTDFCGEKKLKVEDRLRIFRSVCEAVQYAHGQEIIHRDLKPSNILVDADGAPRLLDFGIARELGATENASSGDQTQPGLRFLSPDYAPPEWIRDGNVGFYTDVYSLGVILYELLAGRLPFERSKAAGAENTTNPSPPSTAVRQGENGAETRLSQAEWNDLDLLCLKAMHRDPTQRYSSVEALIRDLDHYLRQEPLEARPESLRYRLDKFVVRNRRAVIASSFLFASVIALVAFFVIRLTQERNRASHEAAVATAMNRFLVDDLLSQGDPFKSGTSSQTLIDAVAQASPHIDLQFRDEPLVAARLHQTIANAFDRRSDFAAARGEYDRANLLFLQAEGSLSQGAVMVRLQQTVMEARSAQAGSLERASTFLQEAQSRFSQIPKPSADLIVFEFTAQGWVEAQRHDIEAASRDLSEAVRRAQTIPGFPQSTLWKIEQALGSTYVQSGDNAKAESLFRELISEISAAEGPDSPRVLVFRANLAQALLFQNKYEDTIRETSQVYPALVAKLGEDNETSLHVLGFREQAEGSLHRWPEAIRDSLAMYQSAVRKQGPGSFVAIASLSDAALSQCRSGQYAQGAQNAGKALPEAQRSYGPHGGLTGAVAYTLAVCDIGLNHLDEASALLSGIDVKAATQLTMDPSVAAEIALAQGRIALLRGEYAAADQYSQAASPVLDKPDADSVERQSLRDLRSAIDAHRVPVRGATTGLKPASDSSRLTRP